MDETKIFNSVVNMARGVKGDLLKRGVAVPAKSENGDIIVGNYTIVKNDNRYTIRNKSGSITYGPLNLAKTAAVIANDLAIGKHVDRALLDHDAKYGYKEFEEMVAKHKAASASVEDIDVFLYNAAIANELKKHHKRIIDSRFATMTAIVQN